MVNRSPTGSWEARFSYGPGYVQFDKKWKALAYEWFGVVFQNRNGR